MDLSGDKLALGAVALLAAAAAMSSARGGRSFSQICIKDANGSCRFCGSPTVDGKHAWGWRNCQNRLPDSAETPTTYDLRLATVKPGQVYAVGTGTARVELVVPQVRQDRYGGAIRMVWVRPPPGGRPGDPIVRDLPLHELRELLEDV